MKIIKFFLHIIGFLLSVFSLVLHLAMSLLSFFGTLFMKT